MGILKFYFFSERFEDCIVSYPESQEIVTRMQKVYIKFIY